jgi:hypothetical protein
MNLFLITMSTVGLIGLYVLVQLIRCCFVEKRKSCSIICGPKNKK